MFIISLVVWTIMKLLESSNLQPTIKRKFIHLIQLKAID